MPHKVIMPALGMAQDTGLIVAWHKSPGDPVAEGDVLFEVETDKATMEVEAQAAGFLTQVRAKAGDDVPVGDVIAVIGEAAEVDQAEEPSADAALSAPDLPKGNRVIMPALGMAQDTGLIVAWHKAPGDAVTSGDVLFEVETDKSTMEVEAGCDGFVAALLAEAGEEAPVGEVIAVIAVEKPENPVQKSRARTTAPAAEPAPVPIAKTPEKRDARPRPVPALPASGDGRILASPKARRLALEQGLDLGRLVEAGHPQPYHVSDLEVLKTLPAAAPVALGSASRRLTATPASDGFAGFATWAAQNADLSDPRALLAGLAGASLGCDAIVAVESFGDVATYAAPMGPLSHVEPADPEAVPALTLRDLRMSSISGVDLGPEDRPVLTLTRAGAGLTITLECAAHHMTAREAVALISNFAGRMEQPLRHLL
ncbi:pyruvate dehydrogenase [Ruegeria pomeroyi]|uniref:Pyruvate dehydrogenase n=1 Tax=Ruegeria pomeroyi TaxID=89184 RepID=A0A9Q3WM04_9RHOB|nr:biotin/lipoyl-containing protein [Ruegeria pomeroyi]MCE8538219.1 pyruvate dehydrogenase [Ruegeria pomeroyi]